ncbi:sensory neuron membrane protein 2-like isoform X1 [Folsomia candida]|uniref:sensory neuron membrane protein 2-like isoform X1 n=1 Tax=Folsomia candida TaxID=158441 RepID=UPI001604BDC1|nr:sensory neuron membrane protein 2-like isoform X1 [Folsomia candida]
MYSSSGRIFLVGIVLLVSTITIFWFLVPIATHWKMSQLLRFEEGGEVFEAFKNIKVQIFSKVYIYNVTNPEDVASGKSLPKFVEIGPYVYEKTRKTIPLRLDPEEDTFTYQTKFIFQFRPDLSNGSEWDKITILNVPLVAIADKLKQMPRPIQIIAQEYIDLFEAPLFLHTNVKSALFDGIHSDIVESISNLLGVEIMRNNTFGYFTEKNGTTSLPYVVNAGLRDFTKLGSVISFNGQTSLDVWPDKRCNAISGSDGVLYSPFVTRESILRGFNPDICRSWSLDYKGDEEYEGISGYRFGIPKNFYDVSAPENECFCEHEDKSKCLKNGALSLTPCLGAPMVYSNPHFLYGHPNYGQLAGNPNPERDDTVVIIEPTTGIVLMGSLRMQLNLEIKKSKVIKGLGKVKDTLFPLFWVNEVATHLPKAYENLRWRVAIPLTLVEIAKWASLVASVCAIIVGVIIFFTREKHRDWYGYRYTFGEEMLFKNVISVHKFDT